MGCVSSADTLTNSNKILMLKPWKTLFSVGIPEQVSSSFVADRMVTIKMVLTTFCKAKGVKFNKFGLEGGGFVLVWSPSLCSLYT